MLPLHRGLQQLLDASTRRLLASHLTNGVRRHRTTFSYPLDEFHRKLPKSKRINPVERNKDRIYRVLSALLRHGDEMERLHLPMRKDGYVAVTDLLNHPRLQGVDVFMLEKVVRENGKNRFNMIYQPQLLPFPGTSSQTDFWWIRANQGHSLRTVEVDLEAIVSPSQVRMAVHGTTLDAWESIFKQGLSTMGRNHIHLAQGVGGADIISGMRTSSQVLIFVNLEKALAAGIKFYLSSNGVVLTPGNQLGFLETKFFARVEKIRMKKTLLLGEAIPDLPETTWTSEDVTTEPALKTGEGKSTSDLP